MKLALLAALVTFAGSIAGFQAVTASTAGADDVATQPATSEQVVVKQPGADCPWDRESAASETDA